MRFAVVEKHFEFEAAHQLPGHNGKCARPHGHSYKLDVAVRGPIIGAAGRSDDGMVIDFGDLSALVREAVISRLDHQDLNAVTGIRTTAENLAWYVWDLLVAAGLDESRIHRIRLAETAGCHVEITQAERDG